MYFSFNDTQMFIGSKFLNKTCSTFQLQIPLHHMAGPGRSLKTFTVENVETTGFTKAMEKKNTDCKKKVHLLSLMQGKNCTFCLKLIPHRIKSEASILLLLCVSSCAHIVVVCSIIN